MNAPGHPSRLPNDDAQSALLLLAIAPSAAGGAVLEGLPGPGRDRWLATLAGLLPAGAPVVKVPAAVGDDRLYGGLDFAASLAAGKPVFASGLLEAADGGLLLLAMAERLPAATAAAVAALIDRREVVVERDGTSLRAPCKTGVIALDESLPGEEGVAAALVDRLAFRIAPETVPAAERDAFAPDAAEVAMAREAAGGVEAGPAVIESLCQAAAALGIDSPRAVLLCLAAARAAAAWRRSPEVEEADAAVAARLVLAPRATRLPQPPGEDEADSRDEQAPDPDAGEKRDGATDIPEDVVLAAAAAALPPGLLERLKSERRGGARSAFGGKAGRIVRRRRRGRPVGIRRTPEVHGERLNLLATLKCAAPWQRLRGGSPGRLRLAPDDLHVTQFEDATEATTIFAVDASGSQAAARLAEVKGAVELLLADCYVRRDQVALVAFRGDTAEIVLPPTRALARAKRALAALPGGGGTPLAAGIDAARELAAQCAGLGRTPAVVFLTDGRANVARDGTEGAGAAQDDALVAARYFAAAGLETLLLDTSRRPRPAAREIAAALGAAYLPLPRADAGAIESAVRRRVAA